jgi:hypothetical protein
MEAFSFLHTLVKRPDGVEVGAGFEQVRGEAMAEHVGIDTASR